MIPLCNIDDGNSKADSGQQNNVALKSIPADGFKSRSEIQKHPKHSKSHGQSASLRSNTLKPHVAFLRPSNTHETTINADSRVTPNIHPTCSEDLETLTKIQAPISQRLELAVTCLLLLLCRGTQLDHFNRRFTKSCIC